MKQLFSFFCQANTALLTSIALIYSFPSLANAQQQASSVATSNVYPQGVIQDYMSRCRQRVLDAGLSSTQAQNLCSCTLNKLRSRFTSEEYIELRQRAVETGRTPKAFTQVGMMCFGELSSR